MGIRVPIRGAANEIENRAVLGVTKRFKVNINIGGAWQVGESALNNTITFGTRLLL